MSGVRKYAAGAAAATWIVRSAFRSTPGSLRAQSPSRPRRRWGGRRLRKFLALMRERLMVKVRHAEGDRIEDRHPMVLAHPRLAVGRQPDRELGEVPYDDLGEGFFRERIEIREGAEK